ncbi:MAG: sensor histidine kinase, partial [Chloroflexota bacterium]|nr:sensor histidine kinase [Chloroflexota bacterium]
ADAGRSWHNEPVLIKPLVEDLCRQAKLLEPGRMIGCDNVLDLIVMGYHDALKQVLLILLDNALKFTPPNGTISITTAAADKHVAISVRDTGIGIEPAALPHIFERFYRSDAARTGAGAGLGLAIAKTLVEAQQGTITVQSQVGQGSVFTVTLPQAEVRPEPEDEPVLSSRAR